MFSQRSVQNVSMLDYKYDFPFTFSVKMTSIIKVDSRMIQYIMTQQTNQEVTSTKFEHQDMSNVVGIHKVIHKQQYRIRQTWDASI